MPLLRCHPGVRFALYKGTRVSPPAQILKPMIFQTLSGLPSTFGVDEYSVGLAIVRTAETDLGATAQIQSSPCVKTESSNSVKPESVSALLVELCTSGWSKFFSTKEELLEIPISEMRAQATRLLAKNPRSFKLLSIVFHPAFLSDWHHEDTKNQVTLFGAVAAHSLDRSMKEMAFHQVAKAIRKEVLLTTSSCKPTKLRLRDCHQLIAQFMHEYALVSEANRSIVLNALAEAEVSGCGHIPSQQANALKKKLERSQSLG